MNGHFFSIKNYILFAYISVWCIERNVEHVQNMIVSKATSSQMFFVVIQIFLFQSLDLYIFLSFK